MQISLAVVGTLSGFAAFGVGGNILWAIGSLFLSLGHPDYIGSY